jgi:hypothetical protein
MVNQLNLRTLSVQLSHQVVHKYTYVVRTWTRKLKQQIEYNRLPSQPITGTGAANKFFKVAAASDAGLSAEYAKIAKIEQVQRGKRLLLVRPLNNTAEN